MDDQMRAELLAREAEDQRIRHAVMAADSMCDGRLPDDLRTEWERIDNSNNRWLHEVVDARGWPGRSLIGPHPIEASERLDEWRAAVGLGPFAEYEARIRARDPG